MVLMINKTFIGNMDAIRNEYLEINNKKMEQ